VPQDLDAVLWSKFVAQAKRRNILNLVEVAKAHITRIKSVLKVEVLNWPPLGHNEVNKIQRYFESKDPDYISNNGQDFPDLKPFVFSVFDEMGNSMGEARLIVTQDCEWPDKERRGSNWRSWGIVTNFSLKLVSNEPKNSYSSSSSYYSTSSKI
jgi:hypothetical protein